MNRYRQILLLLLACNLLIALWYLVIPAAVYLPVSVSSSDTILHRRELDLQLQGIRDVSGTSVVESGTLVSEAAGELVVASAPRCLMLGPFESEQQPRFWFSDINVEFEVRVQRVQDTDAPLYRAYSPAVDGRSGAAMLLSEIREAIQRSGAQIDSYIVTSGALENAISLGLFGDQTNALNVQRILGELGINVLVESELRFINEYWIVAKFEYYADFKRKMDDMPIAPLQAVGITEILCETIAQAE